jgi:hypothetical protein
MTKIYNLFHVKYLLWLFLNNMFFSGLSKKNAISNLMDIRPEGGDLLPKADERTERRTGRQTL